MKLTVESKYNIGDTVYVSAYIFNPSMTYVTFLIKAKVTDVNPVGGIHYLVEDCNRERKWVYEEFVKSEVDDEQH